MTRSLSTVRVEPGEPLPLGLSEACDGFNLAVFSRHATRLTLLLFDGPHGALAATVPLDPDRHRTGDVWHARLVGLPHGAAYALRAEGPFAPAEGHRFDPTRTLLDPFASAVTTGPDGAGRCLVADQRFDWGDDRPPRHPWRDTVIYETHVRGLTAHPSSGARQSGCFGGVSEMIPYLRKLGVTALELMPVQEAAALGRGARDPETAAPLPNYWGYDPVALFAPRAAYAFGGAEAAFAEFKAMVRELHRAGIEVILDVVFNHTAEGGADGPTFAFRGLDNAIYYLLGPGGGYADFTGCGNTLNCNHPVVRSLLVDCLRHWVMHGHVDGFRFDLASVLGRGPDGALLSNPPLLEQIAEDPILRQVKLIAEAWDSAGAFQVGDFPHQAWAEWNARYRDDVRRFWRGDPGMTGAFATRLCGSSDLYGGDVGGPLRSVNFVTSHDGFTLNDLVTYARRHNEANGEGNRDGPREEFSDNNGAEGPSEDPAVEAVRRRQVRNLLATPFLSRGVPMLLGGDEFRRTQRGNSNPWCQDNGVSWYDWDLARRNADLVRFVRGLTALRQAHPVLAAERFYTAGEIAWFGPEGGPPDWHGPENRLGCVIREEAPAPGGLCLLFNAARRPARFVLPVPPASPWGVALDTAATPPGDIGEPGAEPSPPDPAATVLPPRSTLVLVSR
ncbi:glycogen operon protein [Roseomonas rosea]|uniref:Glycogen operon protein n=1 Tax=Muricoccus roseus TaxID=198092 RepID=A0A1M6RKN8_9PROT|nr:isoamylase [Roseomonas rosea]SHK32907.1 glycogen operon protein [Roseomonas rosea]